MNGKHCTRTLAAVLLIAPMTVAAQSMTVIGGEFTARQCYMSATLAAQLNMASRQDLDACNYALDHATISIRDRAATFLNRGIINVAIERYDDAKKDYEKARSLAPDHGEIYVNRGNIFFMGQAYDQAVSEYSQAIALGLVKKHIAHFNRALAYEKMKEYGKAEADYRTAIELSPQWDQPKARLQRLQERQAKDT